jgi:hypothetical protein
MNFDAVKPLLKPKSDEQFEASLGDKGVENSVTLEEMGCACNLCKRSSEFFNRIASLPANMQEYLRAVFDTMLDLEFSDDYYRAVFDGSWPDAETVLEQALTRIRAKKNVNTTPTSV